MKKLTKDQILWLHEDLVRSSGGINGLRDEGLLESALSAPFQTFDGVELYPSLQQKAARLGYSLIKNHPFLDGNKRIGTHAMLIFLELNGILLQYSQTELSNIILQIVAGEKPVEALVGWISEHELG